MAREAHYDLSDAEKRDLIKLIEQGSQGYDFVFVDQTGFETHEPKSFVSLEAAFAEYKS